jgi:hypothetical protein
MKLTTAFSLVLPAMLLAPAARAVDLTPWGSMPRSVNGSIKITTKSGKTFKGYGATFLSDQVSLGSGETVPREEVKEITVRVPRERCCDVLWLGVAGVAFGVLSVPDDAVAGIAITLISLPVAAVLTPPALIIEGVYRLLPGKLVYKVVP